MTPRRKPRPAPDIDALMRRHWPYDGPHSPELVLAASAMIVELVEYINNATIYPDSTLPHPEVSAKLASYFQQTASRLQQASHQLLPPRKCWTDVGTIVADGSALPQAILDEAASRLRAVESTNLPTLASEYGRLHSLLNHLGIKVEEEN